MVRQNHLYQLHSGFKVHSNSAQTNCLLKPLAQEISSSTCISCKVVSKSIQTQLKLHASWSECDHNCAGTVTSTRTRSTRYHYKSFETKLLVNSSSTPTYSKVFTRCRFTSRNSTTRYHHKYLLTKLLVNSSSTPMYPKVFTKFRFTSCGWHL